MSKNSFLFTVIRKALLILCIDLPLILQAQLKHDTISFLHLTDTHICNLTGYHPFFIKSRMHYGNGVEPLRSFFQSIPQKTNSLFAVLTGDNIDYFEAETEKGEILDTQVEQFTTLMKAGNIPVYHTLGNHDVATYWVDSETSYTSHQFHAGKAQSAWIRNTPCFRDGIYYSRDFSVGPVTYRFIFLNNSYYLPGKKDPGKPQFVIDETQLYWLDHKLQESSSDIEIICMHMALPVGKDVKAEPVDLNSLAGNSADLVSVLNRNSSVRLILTGHFHNNTINTYRFTDGKTLVQVMTDAFSKNPDNWRLVKLTANSIIISYPGNTKTEYAIPVQTR